MVAPANPSSTTGQISLMKRASEVPPLVEKNGAWPVTLATVSLTSWVNLPGAVRKDTPLVWLVMSIAAARSLRDALGAVLHPVDQAFGRVLVVEADIECGARLAGNHIGGGIAHIHAGEGQGGGIEMLAALVQLVGGELGDQLGQHRNRILGLLRIADMALHARAP